MTAGENKLFGFCCGVQVDFIERPQCSFVGSKRVLENREVVNPALAVE